MPVLVVANWQGRQVTNGQTDCLTTLCAYTQGVICSDVIVVG